MAEPDIELLTGPLLILVSFGFMLFGVFCAQVYFYWCTYVEDSDRFRSYVFLLCFLEVVHTGFCLHILYTYFVTDATNLPAIGHIIWSTGVTVYLEILIVSMTQGFYIYRVYQLNGQNVLIILPPAVALFGRVSFGFATGVLTYIYDTWHGFEESHAAVITMNCGLVLAAVVDILCTSLLTYYLRRNRSHFRRMRHLIQTLMFYTINTGLLTMISSLAIVFMFNFVNNSLMFAGMVELISKLYANSMLALLNARNKMKDSLSEGDPQSIPLSLRGGIASSGTPETGSMRIEMSKNSDTTNHSDLAASNSHKFTFETKSTMG